MNYNNNLKLLNLIKMKICGCGLLFKYMDILIIIYVCIATFFYVNRNNEHKISDKEMK